MSLAIAVRAAVVAAATCALTLTLPAGAALSLQDRPGAKALATLVLGPGKRIADGDAVLTIALSWLL